MPVHERCNEVARKVLDEPSEDVVANAKKERAARRNPFARIALFIRQVIAELKKVVTPTRKELVSFTVMMMTNTSTTTEIGRASCRERVL